jgi:hypothetical protein
MQVSTSARPLGFYNCSGDFFDRLQSAYGCRLEQMKEQDKKLFRAALANYQSSKLFWVEDGNSTSIEDCAIVCAGGDDLDIWDSNPELVKYIQEACRNLADNEIESLICAISAQIRG